MPDAEKGRECRLCGQSKIVVTPSGSFAKAELCAKCATVCRLCDNVGFVFERDSFGREFATRCECGEIKRKIDLFNAAKIPSRFYDATFDNFIATSDSTQKGALAQARFLLKNYRKESWRGLLFMGGVGVGKTRLVCTMVRHYTLTHGIPCLFKDFSALLSEIKAGYDQGLSESHVLDRINSVDILVVDELGKGRGSDWEINILDTIISNRYNMRKTTIFTTNYTDSKHTTYREKTTARSATEGVQEFVKLETLEQRVLPRIYSRLREMCDFVEIKGGDFRQPSSEIIT